MKAWIALRRPLLLAFVLGCAVTLMTSGRLTLRLLIPATVYWSFVPLCEIASLALVSKGRKIALGEAIDAFSMSDTGWLLWLTVFAVWTMSGGDASKAAIAISALPALGWSAYLDFGFFRRVLGPSRGRAIYTLLVQRLLCWTAALLVFLASSGWQVTESALGL